METQATQADRTHYATRLSMAQYNLEYMGQRGASASDTAYWMGEVTAAQAALDAYDASHPKAGR